MKIYLVSASKRGGIYNDIKSIIAQGIPNWKPYILESFYYANEDKIQELMPYFGDFLLDSGAFTFMQNSKTHVNWYDYAKRYVEFINLYNVNKYIEMDLDYIVGYKETLKLRDYLESNTGKKCIPVWHPCRGKQEFFDMCEQYDYVALGGIVGQKWRGVEKYMPWFISEAHKRGAKIHGLGFTQLTKLKTHHFDSVDSTAWTTGNRFGFAYYFDGQTMRKIDRPQNTRLQKEKVSDMAVHNFVEWCKFQQYADTHL